MENTHRGYVRPEIHLLEGSFPIGDLIVTPFPVEHASMETFGFRFTLPDRRSLAYVSDVKVIPDPSLALLQDLDVLIIDALRMEDHPTHLTLDESLALATSLQPRQTLFTHLAHEIDYDLITAQLPPGIALARDGLKLRFVTDLPCAMVTPPEASSS
jgi:phosphoribosyl 1,2-cyclic phosphate phosphodiesterase